MDTETVLFLRERVPDARLQEALAEAFGIAQDAADKPLVVHYAQGFAVGISIPCDGSVLVDYAAGVLSKRLDTAVLLESSGEAQWLLFAPDASRPLEVQVVELRHGLDVLMPMAVAAPAAEVMHA
jgi:hypothetical protein